MSTAPATGKPDARRRSAAFVFVTVAIDAMGIGIIIPVMPDLLRELSGLPVGLAAVWGGYLTFTYAAMQFLMSPVLGGLSDRYGRRPVLLASLATLCADYLVMAVAPTLWMLFIGRAVAGVAGATYSTATAYIADVTPREGRAAAFGLVGAGFGVGFVFGPALGGLMGELGTRAPFYAAAALALANLAYGALVLPESLPPGRRRAFDWRRANPAGGLMQVARIPAVGWLVAATLLYTLAHYVYPAVWSYYTAEAFGWSSGQIGLSLAAVGVGFAVVQGGLIPLFIRRLGEQWTGYLGFALNIASMVGIGLATQGWMIYALMPVMALGDIAKPALTGIMSNRVPDDAQGELQGVLSSGQSVMTVISPLLMTQIFGVFAAPGAQPYLPGAPFFAAACAMVLALVLFRTGLGPRPAR